MNIMAETIKYMPRTKIKQITVIAKDFIKTYTLGDIVNDLEIEGFKDNSQYEEGNRAIYAVNKNKEVVSFINVPMIIEYMPDTPVPVTVWE
jgi:hypothetical protein